jgi:ABC-2 type transport system ATP-binding protein
MTETILKVNNISKYYEKTKNLFMLKNISFNLNKGEIISIIGLNGAGKTTLIKLLLSITSPNNGHIIYSEDIKKSVIEKIGYLPEIFSLDGLSLTTYNFLKLMAGINGYHKQEQKHVIEELISLFELERFKDKNTKVLSKGMLKRLGVAQTLLGNPEIIILDEPTDGLDPEWRVKMREIITERKKTGISFLISSHLLYEIEVMSDKILIIHNGAQLYFGKPNLNSIVNYFNEFNDDKIIDSLLSKQQQLTLEEIFLNIIHTSDRLDEKNK